MSRGLGRAQRVLLAVLRSSAAPLSVRDLAVRLKADRGDATVADRANLQRALRGLVSRRLVVRVDSTETARCGPRHRFRVAETAVTLPMSEATTGSSQLPAVPSEPEASAAPPASPGAAAKSAFTAPADSTPGEFKEVGFIELPGRGSRHTKARRLVIRSNLTTPAERPAWEHVLLAPIIHEFLQELTHDAEKEIDDATP